MIHVGPAVVGWQYVTEPPYRFPVVVADAQHRAKCFQIATEHPLRQGKEYVEEVLQVIAEIANLTLGNEEGPGQILAMPRCERGEVLDVLGDRWQVAARCAELLVVLGRYPLRRHEVSAPAR